MKDTQPIHSCSPPMAAGSPNASLQICFVLGSMNVGGVQTFLLRLIGFLTEQGHKVTVLTTRDRGAWWYQLAEVGAKGYCFPWYKSFCPFTHAIRLGRWLRDSSFHAVVLNHAREAQLSLNMLGDSQAAIPIVHNDTAGIFRTACLNPLAWNVMVAVSPKLASRTRERVPSRPIEHINYAVDLPDQDRFADRKKWDNELKLLYVGRLIHEQKGVLLLPEILAACERRSVSCTLTIIGHGPEQEALQAGFGAVGLDSQVTFLGALDPHDVMSQMLEHHVMLMPSRYEGLGIVALEAQACGCVPVASKLPGVTDHSIVDGQSGFLASRSDPEAFSEYVASLTGNGDLWRRMSLAGRAHVLRHFTVPTMGRAYESLFGRLRAGHYPLPRSRRRRHPVDLRSMSWRDLIPNILRRVRHGCLH